jgi:hypothetical protein
MRPLGSTVGLRAVKQVLGARPRTRRRANASAGSLATSRGSFAHPFAPVAALPALADFSDGAEAAAVLRLSAPVAASHGVDTLGGDGGVSDGAATSGSFAPRRLNSRLHRVLDEVSVRGMGIGTNA